MVQHDNKGVPEAVEGAKPQRRRDRFLPLLIDRQARSRVADRARNVLAKHHHAVAGLEDRADHDRVAAAARYRSRIDDWTIERIRSTQ